MEKFVPVSGSCVLFWNLLPSRWQRFFCPRHILCNTEGEWHATWKGLHTSIQNVDVWEVWWESYVSHEHFTNYDRLFTLFGWKWKSVGGKQGGRGISFSPKIVTPWNTQPPCLPPRGGQFLPKYAARKRLEITWQITITTTTGSGRVSRRFGFKSIQTGWRESQRIFEPTFKFEIRSSEKERRGSTNGKFALHTQEIWKRYSPE